MRKKTIVTVIALLLCASVTTFAAEKKSSSGLASFNGPGTVDLTVTVGYTRWGFGLNGGLEYTVSQFDLGTVPLSWGLKAQGSTGFGSDGIGIAASGLATLNMGFDFGKSLKFELYFGLGPGIVLETWGGAGLGAGIAENFGGTWWFSNTLGLTLEQGYVSAFSWGSWYFAGIGFTLKI